MTHPVWERKVFYLVRSGSHAYGMATPESDVDLRGICLLDREHVFGTHSFKSYEPNDKSDSDICIYGLPQYLYLAAACNPNVLELLAVTDENVMFSTPESDLLRENINLFLSTKAQYSFSGYAFSQLKRIKRHRAHLLNPPKHKPSRTEFGLPEARSVVNASEMNAYMWLITQLLEQTAAGSKLSIETKEELAAIDWTGMVQSADLPDNAAPILEKLTPDVAKEMVQAVMAERRYKNAMRGWEAYQSWKKNRNPARAKMEKKSGYDTKNASHLCRLLQMGIEVLNGEGVIVKRPEAEWLLGIRRGEMTYDELIEWADRKEVELIEAAKNSALPKTADHNAIEQLQMEMLEAGFSYKAPLETLYKNKTFGEDYPYDKL